jgi:hypothetical protein
MHAEHESTTLEHLIIVVCSREEASAILSYPSQHWNIAFLCGGDLCAAAP